MFPDLNPRQARALVRLAFTPDGRVEKASDLKPALATKDRRSLSEAGLLSATRQGRRLQIELTEEGWSWVAENLRHPFPKGSNFLSDVLTTLANYLQSTGTAFSDFVRHLRPAAAVSRGDLRDEILREALDVNDGRANKRVRLSRLRHRLSLLSREDLDRALLQLQDEGRISLFPIDLPADRDATDEEAAVDVAGEKRHILYVRQ